MSQSNNPFELELLTKMGISHEFSGDFHMRDTQQLVQVLAQLPKMKIVMNTDAHNFAFSSWARLAWDVEEYEYPSLDTDQLGDTEDNPLEPQQRPDGSWYVIGDNGYSPNQEINLILMLSGS